VILDEGGHDKRGRPVEVYDHSHPSFRIEITTIESLALWRRILLAVVWSAHSVQDRRGVLGHLWPTALQMADGALVEDDETTIGVESASRIERHPTEATSGLRRFA
jgi:hypothetical protein